LVRQVLRNPEARLLALDHQLKSLGPSLDHAVQRERDRHAARDGAVKHLSVRRPSCVVDRHRAARAGMSRAGAGLDDFIREAAWRLLRIRRRRLHVDGSGDARDRNQLDIEHERALRLALTFVCERFRNPETALLAFNHQLNAFGPAGDDAIERKARRFAAENRAVEHRAVGFPTGVVHRNDVRGARVSLRFFPL